MKQYPSWLIVIFVSMLAGCLGQPDNPLLLPPDTSSTDDSADLTLVVRMVHITDAHCLDVLSPARFAGSHEFVAWAWRSWENYSTQLLDGIIRTTNRIHASGQMIDFLLHTGDACDNAQTNELDWFLGVMDGRRIEPLSGPDDRPEERRPIPTMDPFAGFTAQGLYRQSVHGSLPSIPWYTLLGNHDVYALGTFPVVTESDGRRIAPLPLSGRPGLLLPVELDPADSWAYGNVTPADPGPPPLLECPRPVVPNPQRAYFTQQEFVQSLQTTVTGPIGHGFADPQTGPLWYSLSPKPGLRLIGLNTSDQVNPWIGFPYSEGCISQTQQQFLRSELDAAQQRGEIVIVATHHPSQTLDPLTGSTMIGVDLQNLLRRYPNVVLHLTGHIHRNRVADRGGYLEIETCSPLDWPQEGRIVEIWRSNADGSLQIRYRMFSHLDDTLPPLGDDPLRGLRDEAHAIAKRDDNYPRRPNQDDIINPAGSRADREGVVVLQRGSSE